ncbi:MAG TPA: alpha/beta hydrolase [Stellaceae bacterium]|nr:alpha/beta hydrolase [Stellaceae bacterium]
MARAVGLIAACGVAAALLWRPGWSADAMPERFAYGTGPSQFGELWLPQTAAAAPVVVMVHGGCWQSSYGLDLMRALSADLQRGGIAVWNIEYRRLGESGGGYPGTFADIGAAVDALRGLATTHPLSLAKVIAVGHSAGGHLALWAAARHRLPATSPIASRDPLRLAGAITLAGINDLAAYAENGPACGGTSTINRLIDAAGRPPGTAYADTSPRALLPIGVPQMIASGSRDGIVPADLGRAYGAAAKAAGDPVDVVEISGADHFALIEPGSAAWKNLRPRLLDMLR